MNRLKHIILFVTLFVSYLIYPEFIILLLKLCHVPVNHFSTWMAECLQIGILFSYMLILFLIYRKSLKEEIKDFKENLKTYLKIGSKAWLIGVIIMVISNMIILRIYPTNAANEISVQEAFQAQPIYIFISAVFIAPIIEEIIFRKSMRPIFQNPYVYIICSGLLFGYIHTLANPTNPLELLYIIPYGVVGMAFSYLYQKYNNIFIPIFFHALHNTISLSISFFFYFIF